MQVKLDHLFVCTAPRAPEAKKTCSVSQIADLSRATGKLSERILSFLLADNPFGTSELNDEHSQMQVDFWLALPTAISGAFLH